MNICMRICIEMRRRKGFLTFVMALGLLCSAGAQEQTGFIARTIDKLKAPLRELDPAAIYQPEPRWTFALTGDFHQAGITQDIAYTVGVGMTDDVDNVYMEDVPATISSKLISNVDNSIGFQAGYGSLSLALNKQISKSKDDQTFSFDYQSAGYALQVQFFNLSHPVSYHSIVADPSHWGYHEWDETTLDPGHFRSLIVDAFYAFNRRTFAYSAAYKGNMFQKRSAGSWMFGTKVILGEFAVEPDEPIVSWAGGLGRQTSAQVSFGGGYSYNLVPLHRQPYADRDKGLRNLTMNVTFLPMVTLFNQFTGTTYFWDLDGNYTERKDIMNGKLLVNYVARVGVSYSHDLFTVNLSASHDSFSYKGTTSILLFGVDQNGIRTHGNFSRWTVALRLGKRF